MRTRLALALALGTCVMAPAATTAADTDGRMAPRAETCGRSKPLLTRNVSWIRSPVRTAGGADSLGSKAARVIRAFGYAVGGIRLPAGPRATVTETAIMSARVQDSVSKANALIAEARRLGTRISPAAERRLLRPVVQANINRLLAEIGQSVSVSDASKMIREARGLGAKITYSKEGQMLQPVREANIAALLTKAEGATSYAEASSAISNARIHLGAQIPLDVERKIIRPEWVLSTLTTTTSVTDANLCYKDARRLGILPATLTDRRSVLQEVVKRRVQELASTGTDPHRVTTAALNLSRSIRFADGPLFPGIQQAVFEQWARNQAFSR